MAIELTSETFDQRAAEGKKMLVDFWASWCGPCRMMSPVLDELAQERKDLLVCKVNVDEEPELAARYGVDSIPNFVLFKNGEVAGRHIGSCPKSLLEELIDSV